MWSDNETTIDLLGFDYLVDSLEVVLTEPRLLPVTIGVLGDWGSGKTSLLRMVADRLSRESPDDQLPEYVVVSFSPWLHEGSDDVKAALMDAVLHCLDAYLPSDDTARREKVGTLQRIVRRMKVGSAAATKVIAPAAISAAAQHHGMSPQEASAAASALGATVEAIAGQIKADGTADQLVDVAIESMADFRREFEQLVDGLDHVKAVIVLIDDLDRCLDDTVVDVLEAIRLFLQVSSTAFVIAANREIVQAAVERRYPAARDGDASLGRDYLEKIIQVELTVPALSEPEAETYLNLLFADLRLNDEQMAEIRSEATKRRAGLFSVAMNYGIAKSVLGELSPALEADFAIANQVAPTLSRGLRGNPRQLKRFLNTMLLRIATAKRRGVTLDAPRLAKLMVLEQLAEKEFQQLFRWQVAQEGSPDELAIAEAARASGQLPDDASDELKAWFASPVVARWLALDPPLAGLALGEYFFFSRDRLSHVSSGSRLSAPLQALLSRLQSSIVAQRRTAIQQASGLAPEEQGPLYSALLDRASRAPRADAMDSALELTALVPTNWPAFVAMLGKVPPNDVTNALAVRLITVGRARTDVQALIGTWKESTNTRLKAAIAEATKGNG